MVTEDTLNALQTVLGHAWYMMCHVDMPGLAGVSLGAWFLAGLIISFVLALLRYNFGIGGTDQRLEGYHRSAEGKHPKM